MRAMDAINAHPLPALNLADRRIFVANLLFMHALMIAFESLTETLLKRRMPANLRGFYVDHLEAERGHADMLEADLATLGAAPALDWHAAQIAGTQYYLVRHGPVEALLGYMAALECRPMLPAVVDELEAIHGPQAVRTLRLHAEADPEHGADVLGMIESLDEPETAVANAALTASMLKTSLEHIGRPTCQ